MIFGSLFRPKNLWSAAKRGDVRAIEELVKQGHDVNAKKNSLNIEGETPLHFAASAGKKEAIKALVRLGARIDAKDNHGMTPLMNAVTEADQEDVAGTLLDCGAKIDVQDRDGMTALDWAAFYGQVRLVAFLLERGAKTDVGSGKKRSSPVAQCVLGGKLEVLNLLIQADADLNAPGNSTPLCSAAANDRLDFVKALLAGGADPNYHPPGEQSPLMIAARAAGLEIVEALVKAGASVNEVNEINAVTRETALDIAVDPRNVKKRDPAMAAFLKSVGAKHSKDIEKPKQDTEELHGERWSFPNDAEFTALLEPWPPTEGPAELKVELTTNEDDTAFDGTVEFRLAGSKKNEELWRVMAALGTDEEGTARFAVPIKLARGLVYLQFRIQDDRDDEATELSDWKLEIR